MFRSLCGSRMHLALHPRVDPHASSYWEEDTVSSQEIARVMEEEGHSDTNPDVKRTKKGYMLVTTALGGDNASLRSSISTLPSEVESLDGMTLADVDSLRVEDMSSSPVNSQLSPAGLISIAAADIDQAATNSLQNVPPVNGELDLAFIRSLRRVPNTKSNSCNPFHVVDTALTQMLGSTPMLRGSMSEHSVADDSKLFSLVRRHINLLKTSSSSSSVAANETKNEGPSKLRFLSLLRRVNELRSQQVNAESWSGLPYPQIIALPTFKYQLRELPVVDTEQQTDNRLEINNTVCAVCCDEFKANEEVRTLPCLHFYHRECIDQWLMCHRQCPICKHVVSVY